MIIISIVKIMSFATKLKNVLLSSDSVYCIVLLTLTLKNYVLSLTYVSMVGQSCTVIVFLKQY